ncbi:biotin/lipoyl-binding protein [Paraflavitalea speifideaquila]|uniref:biotin/lipoyl-binding protein n=1 Tax=Paraflavitalea speifideaquila TaxID=3076558 RepID=UPI0028EB457C|nr:biotin/lipoyl-binding protein [Paraflavitalea speifideiaquila]
MKKIITAIVIIAAFLTACNNKKALHDASGTFEVDEVIVSSELTGKLLSFEVTEGDSIPKGKIIGTIDAENLSLQKRPGTSQY